VLPFLFQRKEYTRFVPMAEGNPRTWTLRDGVINLRWRPPE